MAFTLAETLITLAIIGVIAALTVPNLIAKYENEQNYVLLRKYQSVLANALALIVKEEGPTSSWGLRNTYTPSNMQIMGYLSKHIKIEKVCRDTPGCWSNTPTKALNQKTTVLYGSKNGIGASRATAKLSSGANICVAIWNGVDAVDKFGNPTSEDATASIWVDVNGDKGPNVAGRDTFAFVLTGETLIPAGAGKHSQAQKCDVSNMSNTSGYQCAYKVLKERGIKY